MLSLLNYCKGCVHQHMHEYAGGRDILCACGLQTVNLVFLPSGVQAMGVSCLGFSGYWVLIRVMLM